MKGMGVGEVLRELKKMVDFNQNELVLQDFGALEAESMMGNHGKLPPFANTRTISLGYKQCSK